MVDLSPKDITGNVAEETLESVGIITNKNVIPYDIEKPMVTSGLRLGTSAISTRGMGKDEVVKIAEWIDFVLMNPHNQEIMDRVTEKVSNLCYKFPIYPP